MLRRLSLLTALCLTGALFVAAQENATEPKPRLPVPARAPEKASWTLTYLYKPAPAPSDPSAPPPAPPERSVSLEIQKSGKMYWERHTLSSGQKSEKWVFGDIQLMTRVGSETVMVIPAPAGEDFPSPDFSEYNRSDFPGLNWLSLENYRGLDKYQGQAVFKFEDGRQSALLAVDTQLPLVASDGQVTVSYSYGTAPDALTPPRHIQAALESYKRGLRLLKPTPSRP